MFQLLQLLYRKIKDFDDTYRERRYDHYFLGGNPLKLLCVVTAYYVFVKIVGPKLMQNRRAFELKNILLIYNVLQVLSNAILCGKILYTLIVDVPYPNLACMMPLCNDTDIGRVELHLTYAYFILKIVDYLDTIFFVLRKSYKQVTFLHFYHHIMVSVGTYVYMRYLPGGHATALGLLNTFVHVVMYFYYFVTALRPELRKSLWWKKYITQLQIVQFMLLIVHFARPLFSGGNCVYPRVALGFALLQSFVMAVLFLDFYLKTYVIKKRTKKNVLDKTK